MRAEKRIEELIDTIIANLRKRPKNKRIERVLWNEEYQAEFHLTYRGSWTLISPQRIYEVPSPSLDYLLEKYARLEDPDFNENVGDHALYDTEEDYVNASQRYVQRNRRKFLTGFIGALEKALENSKKP